MQNSMDSLANQRISPDITSVSYSSTTSNSSSSNLNLNTISEVPSELYEFLIGENGEAKILCKVCQYMSNKKSNFKRHFTNMHFVQDDENARLLECCGIRFSTKGEKFQHTKSVHKSGYKCSICTKVFDRPALLQRHLAKHTGKKPYKCSLCSYQTPNKANAKRHIEKKHSDVPEGSILFLTDDGEQIQMEIVSKMSRSGSLDSNFPHSIVKSNADSTSFGNLANITRPLFTVKLPRPLAETVTSSSLLSPRSTVATNIGLTEPTYATSLEINPKRRISHSIDIILNHPLQSQPVRSPEIDTFFHDKAAATSYQENITGKSAPSSYFNSCKHHNINDVQWRSDCSVNWSHTSTLFTSAYSAFKPQAYSKPNTCPNNLYNNNGSETNQAFPTPIFQQFQQCAHGCWHLQNLVPSELPISPVSKAHSSFNSSALSFDHAPDSRSFSSISQTENSSIISSNSEDDNTSIIDVVGDDEENDAGLHLLSTICEGLGSFTTSENKSQEGNISGETETNPIVSPPVGSESENASITLTTPEYVPKKLRVSRPYYK